jgi:hypothetical protein
MDTGMAVWVVLCFHNERGRDLFCQAYADQPTRARAKFRAILDVLRHQPVEGWSRENGFDLLTGKKYRRYHGLGKLRINTPDAAHRPLGFFGPRPRSFTLLVWATERDGEFDPPNVLETALLRMQRVLADPRLADVCDL